MSGKSAKDLLNECVDEQEKLLGKKKKEHTSVDLSELPQLPPDWLWTELGSLCNVQGGFAFKSSEYIDEGVPLIRISNIGNGNEEPNAKTVFLPANFLEKYKEFEVKQGDILIAMSGATTGKFGKYDSEEKALLNQRVGRFRFFSKDPSLRKYTYYYLNILKDSILRDAYGAAQPNISSKGIESFVFPLPPSLIIEQINNKIEELFTRLDAGVEELKKVKAQLKQYRQSVLKHAFEGKLTQEWREAQLKDPNSPLNKEPAAKLLEKIEAERKQKLGKKYKPPKPIDTTNLPKLPEGWVWTSFESVNKKIQDGSHFSPQIQYSDRQPNSFPYVTAKNIKAWGLDISDITYVPEEFHRTIYPRCNPEYGDVVLTKDGVKTGIAAIYNLHEESSLLSSVALFKNERLALQSKYLCHYLNSPSGFKSTTGKMTGTAIKRIIMETLKLCPLPLSHPLEQQKIVEILNDALSIADALEQALDRNLLMSNSLRQSILKSAFEGKLVS